MGWFNQQLDYLPPKNLRFKLRSSHWEMSSFLGKTLQERGHRLLHGAGRAPAPPGDRPT